MVVSGDHDCSAALLEPWISGSPASAVTSYDSPVLTEQNGTQENLDAVSLPLADHDKSLIQRIVPHALNKENGGDGAFLELMTQLGRHS